MFRLVFPALLLVVMQVHAADDPPPAAWPMRSHDERRTGRATVNGPRQGTHVWSYTATDANAINMEPAVSNQGVYFGTWGLSRIHGLAQSDWDKFDGRIIGLDRATGKELWSPLHPGRTPFAYRYDGRKPTEQDKPAGAGMHLNWYNGTVEGTPAIDPKTGHLYVGRGDGVLYAVDPRRGTVLWQFRTLDPARPNDPEGGGEIVGGPLVTREGLIVCATFAAPHRPDPPKQVRHETNAVYCVDRNGKQKWRYPARGTLESAFGAPVALSPDAKRVYAITGLPEKHFPCELIALDLATGKLAWKLDLPTLGGQDLAVGKDGIIYAAGVENEKLGSRPAAFAVRDTGKTGQMHWGPILVDGQRPITHWAGGLALFEQGGRVRDVYVSTTGLRELNIKGGRLHRLDPATGKVTASWNPENAKPATVGTLTDVTLDNEGVIYVGVRGQWKTLTEEARNGRMYALRSGEGGFTVLWSKEVEGQLDWASPALGPKGELFFGSSSAFGPIEHSIPRPADARIPKADCKFYGVRD